jgi:hypothetical protein
VRPVLVVVPAVHGENVLEAVAAEDEDAVKAVAPDGGDPALGVDVRVRRLHGRADHIESLGAEDLVEGVAELPVAISWKRSRYGCSAAGSRLDREEVAGERARGLLP